MKNTTKMLGDFINKLHEAPSGTNIYEVISDSDFVLLTCIKDILAQNIIK